MNKIKLTASGVYPMPVLPDNIAQALADTIMKHMAAYGFNSIKVEVVACGTESKSTS